MSATSISVVTDHTGECNAPDWAIRHSGARAMSATLGEIHSLPESERQPSRANLIAAQNALTRAIEQNIPVFDAIPLIVARLRNDGIAWI
jgi:hypothetical protein